MNDTWYDMGLDADMDWMYNYKGKKKKIEKTEQELNIERLAIIIAKSEAIDFIEYMDKVADANHLDRDFLIKEVITYIIKESKI